MNKLGFIVVSRKTGYMLEGKDHAAKIFDTEAIARRACKPLQNQAPVPIAYDDVARSLLKGSAFCFETEDAYSKFIKHLRNDPGNRPFMAYSKDRTYIKWRHPNATNDTKADSHPSVGAGTSVQAAAAPIAPMEARAFDPAILVREGNTGGP